MDKTLSNNLYELINKHTNGINQEDFYDSLVESTTSETTGRNQTINLKSFFSKVTTNHSLSEKFRQSVLNDRKNISKLYEKYIQSVSDSMKTESMLIELFYLYLAENAGKFARSFSRQYLKPSTFETTKGREEDAMCLKSLLEKHHKIIISGEPGIGKSRFIRYFLTKWKINDYCYISYDNNTDIKTNLHQIQYVDSFGSTYFGSEYELMNERFSSSLLIIDNMYTSPNLLSELEWLSKLNINILVVTLYPIATNSFYLYELPQLSSKNLLQIFALDSGFQISDKCLQEKLLATTGQNALMISLIAKLCGKKLESVPAPSPSVILEDVLCQLEYPTSHIGNKETPTLRHKHEYTDYDKSLDLIGHIKSVCEKSLDYIDPVSKNYLKWLCCFGPPQLPLDFISQLIPDYQSSHMEALHAMGLITLTYDTVQLSSLISYAVFASQPPKPDSKEFKGIFNNLMSFLKTYDETLSTPYLSNALLVFAKTLYKQMLRKPKHNPNQIKTSKQFEDWQELIYLIYNYYNQNGDFHMAEKVVSTISYPNLINSHSFLDTNFFHLSNKMQLEAYLKDIPHMIDELCDIISASPNFIKLTDTTYYIINVLDYFIGLYCHTRTFNPTGINNVEYQHILTIVFITVLKYITQREHDTKLHISNEKIQYYLICQKLITAFPNSFSDCIPLLEVIKKTENVNYRIRGTAFFLFMESHYIYYLHFMRDFLSPNCAGPTQLFQSLLVPEIKYLHEQICSCKLIPINTFRICIYTYISAAMIRYCISSTYKLTIPAIVTTNDIKELVNRSLLSKDELDIALNNIEKYFS